MKKFAKKVAEILQIIFGYGIMICLFAGGFTFFGYIAALLIGGETATAICVFIYKSVFPIIIKTSTILVLVGLLVMYLKGQISLTIGKKEKKRNGKLK